MYLYFISFFAGMLTVLAPCVLPMLPVILGSGMADKSWKRPLIINLSLSLSVVLFSILLRASTALIDIPYWVWTSISGGIIFLFGIVILFPKLWEKCSHFIGLEKASQNALQTAGNKKGIGGAILLGFALGPVFTSCSPTYAIIVATILPVSFGIGLIHIFAYALGLSFILFLITLLGQKIISRLKKISNPKGNIKYILGILLIIVGLAIMTGFDKLFEAFLVDLGWTGIIPIESELLESFNE